MCETDIRVRALARMQKSVKRAAGAYKNAVARGDPAAPEALVKLQELEYARDRMLESYEEDDDFGAVLNCAVRYALGRETYMPGLVCGWIRPRLRILTDKTLYVFREDIIRQARYGYGHYCDENTWQEFRRAVEDEMERRSSKNG